MASYESIRAELKTGDIVLFSGKGAISNVIKLFSGGKWSHVAMILRLKQFGDAVLLWESTTLTSVADIETGLRTKGVQLVPLSQRVQNYDGEINIRHLNKQITGTMTQSLAQCRLKLSRKPYERSEAELLKAAHDGLFGQSKGEDLSSLFCSELVAEAYQCMGLLPEPPKGLPSNEYVPLDFSERRPLALGAGYLLGDEIRIA
jgi:Permuted papain-like amidase enzyme, YaeF/YiiX, C92 family